MSEMENSITATLESKISLITTTNPYNTNNITSQFDTITKTLLFDSLLSFFEEFGGTSHLPHLGLPEKIQETNVQ